MWGVQMENFSIKHRIAEYGFKLRRHYEHCYQMVFIMRGKPNYLVGNKNYIVENGGVVLLNTLEDHSLEVLEYPYERIIVQISPAWFFQEIPYLGIISAFVKHDKEFSHLLKVEETEWKQLMNLLNVILEESKSRKDYWQFAVGSNLRLLLINLKRTCPDTFSKEQNESSKIVLSILNYLYNHFTEDISVDTIAKEMHFNRHYISHIFKGETGYSMMDYVISLRVNMAKELLIYTREKISDISLKCGYTDFAYFARIFRKNTGVTPSAFRKERKEF